MATAPEGRPVALRATDWAAPLVTVVPMVLVAGEPAATLAALGEAEMEKSLGGGGPVTVRVKVVEWVAEVPVPVTVTAYGPGAVPALVVMDMVELDPELMVDGVNVATAPEGRPVALRATDWATPLVTVVPMVLVAGEPAATLAALGEAEMEKSLGGGGPTKGVRLDVVGATGRVGRCDRDGVPVHGDQQKPIDVGVRTRDRCVARGARRDGVGVEGAAPRHTAECGAARARDVAHQRLPGDLGKIPFVQMRMPVEGDVDVVGGQQTPPANRIRLGRCPSPRSDCRHGADSGRRRT